MIRIDAIWLAAEGMRTGCDSCLARVVQVFAVAKSNHTYLFANKSGNRMKVLLLDGYGIGLVARQLHQGKFIWAQVWQGERMALDCEQLDALVISLPWYQVTKITAFRCSNS